MNILSNAPQVNKRKNYFLSSVECWKKKSRDHAKYGIYQGNIETRGVKINTFSPCIMSRQEIDNLLVQNRNRNIDDNKYLYTVFILVY